MADSSTPGMRARRRGGLPGIPHASPDVPAPVAPGTVAETALSNPPPESNPDADPRSKGAAAPGVLPPAAVTELQDLPADRSSEPKAATSLAVDNAPATDPLDPPGAPIAKPKARTRVPAAAAAAAPAPAINPYANARARQFNLRLLDPLNDRYKQLVRELSDEGVNTSFTELLHALLHDGPQTTDDARVLLRGWRQANAAL